MAQTIDNRAKTPSKGTGFTNIQQIVQANRANRLGQAVSGGVSGVVGAGKEQLGQSQQQFQQGAQAGALGSAQDKGFVQQTIAGAGAQAPSQEELSRFEKLRTGQYTGPRELSNRQQLEARGQELAGLAGAATGEYGRRGLLQRFIGPDQYTQGQQRLDTLLLGQTGGQALRQARREAGLFGRELTGAEKAAEAQARGLTEQARQFGEFTRSSLGEAQTTQEQDIQRRIEEEQRQAEAARNVLRASLTRPAQIEARPGEYTTMPVGGVGPTISQEEYEAALPFLERTGLAEKQLTGVERLIGSPEEIIGQGIISPTRETIATEADKARALALARLSGQAPTLFTEETQVGGYDPLAFLNKQLLEQKIGEAGSEYEKGLEAQRQSGLVQRAIGEGQRAIQMLEQDLPLYKQGQPAGGLGREQAEYRLAQQQEAYNKANELLKQAGLSGTGAPGDIAYYAPPGDAGQWQHYMVPEMINLLRGTTEARNLATQRELARRGSELQQQYARNSLLERLQGLIR